MSAPVRVQLSRGRGWRMPANTVKVTRPGKWGNPFNFRAGAHAWTALAHGCRGDLRGRQEASVKAFREWIDPGQGRVTVEVDLGVGFDAGDKGFIAIAPRVKAGPAPTLAEVREALAGKNLACWCKLDEPCHADVLLELANAPICERAGVGERGNEPQEQGSGGGTLPHSEGGTP